MPPPSFLLKVKAILVCVVGGMPSDFNFYFASKWESSDIVLKIKFSSGYAILLDFGGNFDLGEIDTSSISRFVLYLHVGCFCTQVRF